MLVLLPEWSSVNRKQFFEFFNGMKNNFTSDSQSVISSLIFAFNLSSFIESPLMPANPAEIKYCVGPKV